MYEFDFVVSGMNRAQAEMLMSVILDFLDDYDVQLAGGFRVTPDDEPENEVDHEKEP